MNKLLNLTKLFSLLLIISLFASCSKDDNYVKIIPSDASMVMSFNAKALNEKSNVEDITKTEFYQMALEEADKEDVGKIEDYVKLAQHSDENGIDLNNTFYMFMQGASGRNPVVGFTFPLTDKAKFKTVLEEKLTEEEIVYSIVNKNDIEYLDIETGNQALFAWNDKQVLIYANSGNFEETVNNGIELFNNKDETSALSNESFNEFLKNSKDISLWLNYGKFMGMMPPQQMLVYSQLPFDFKDTYAEMHASFNKGEIIVETTFHPNKELEAMMKKYDVYGNSFNTDITDYIPANNYANIGMSVDFNAYYELLREMFEESQGENIDKFIVEFEAQTEMKLDELLDALGGSVYAGIYDIKTKQVETTDWNAYMESKEDNKKLEDFNMMKEVPVPLFAVATDVTDEKVFDLVKKFGQGMFVEKDGYLMIKNRDMNMFLNWNEEVLLFTNDSTLIANFTNSKKADNNLSKSDVGKAIADNNVYIQLNPNTNTYPEGIQNMIRDNFNGSTVVGDFTSIFANVEMKNEGNWNQKMIITMKDDSKNALEVVINAVDSNIENIEEISEK